MAKNDPDFLFPFLCLLPVLFVSPEVSARWDAGAVPILSPGWIEGEFARQPALVNEPEKNDVSRIETLFFNISDELIRQGNRQSIWLLFEYSGAGPGQVEVSADVHGKDVSECRNRGLGLFFLPGSNVWRLGCVRVLDPYFGNRHGPEGADFSLTFRGYNTFAVGRVWAMDRLAPGSSPWAREGPLLPVGGIRAELREEHSGLPIGDFYLRIDDLDRESEVCRLRFPPDGTIRIPSLPAGQYRAIILGSNREEARGRRANRTFRIGPGEGEQVLAFGTSAWGSSIRTLLPSVSGHESLVTGLYLPREYNPRERYPLIVALHTAGESALDVLGCLDLPLPTGYDRVFIYVPNSRGDSGYTGIVEADLFQGLRTLQERFSVNPDRIYLMGRGMGASAAVRLMVFHPNQFAGGLFVEPVTKPDLLGEFPPYFSGLFAETFPFECLPNIVHLPTRWVHGVSSEIVSPEHSRLAAETLQESGAPAELVSSPGGDDRVWEDAFRDRRNLRWLLNQEPLLPEAPTVDFRTPSAARAGTGWARILRLSGTQRPARLYGLWEEQNQIGFETEGIGAFRVRLSDLPINSRENLLIFSNNRILFEKRPPRGPNLDFPLSPETTGFHKSPTSCGPWHRAFEKPFLYVVGNTVEENLLRETMRLPLETSFFLPPAPILLAESLTEDQKKTFNLICFGSPDSSGLFDVLLRQTPIRMEPEAVRLGMREVRGKALSVHVVYPSPYGLDNLIQLNLSYNPEVLSDFRAARHHLPDFAVLDARGRKDPTGWSARAAGWFGEDWEIDEETIYFGHTLEN